MGRSYRGEAEAERRRFPRKPMKLRVSYQCLSKDKVAPVESHLAEDLGSGGLAMRSRQPLLKGQVLMLTLFIPRQELELLPEREPVPDYSEADCVGVNILARVARCSAAGPGEYSVGIQFLDSDGQSRERLKKFLLQYRLYQANSPMN